MLVQIFDIATGNLVSQRRWDFSLCTLDRSDFSTSHDPVDFLLAEVAHLMRKTTDEEKRGVEYESKTRKSV